MSRTDELIYRMTQDGDIFPCRNCGKQVSWQTAKSGKNYLAQLAVWVGDYAERLYFPAHKCVPNPEYQAKRAIEEATKLAKHQADLDNGVVVKGQRVVVSRGRKVPKGTEGTLTWIAEHTDDYGNVRAGVKQDDGTMVWVNLDYLVSKRDWDIEQANPPAPRKRTPKRVLLDDDDDYEI